MLSLFNFSFEVLAFDKVWNLVIIIITFLFLSTFLLLQTLVGFGQPPQASQRVGTELIEDAGYEFSELLVFSVAVNCERVRGNGCMDCAELAQPLLIRLIPKLTLWCSEMYHIAIFLEHIHLFNCLDGLYIQLLE